MLPSIVNQLGPEGFASLRKLAMEKVPAAKDDDVDPLIQAIIAIEGARIDISIQTQIVEQLDLFVPSPIARYTQLTLQGMTKA